MIYRCKHFKAFELVGPELYERFGEDCFRYLRLELLQGIDALWEELNAIKKTSVIVNNWKTGGQYKGSGYRTAASTEYKPGSAHSVGAGVDIKCPGWTPRLVLDVLKARLTSNPFLPNFRRYENLSATPTWNHLDVMEHDGIGLMKVNP